MNQNLFLIYNWQWSLKGHDKLTRWVKRLMNHILLNYIFLHLNELFDLKKWQNSTAPKKIVLSYRILDLKKIFNQRELFDPGRLYNPRPIFSQIKMKSETKYSLSMYWNKPMKSAVTWYKGLIHFSRIKPSWLPNSITHQKK